MNSTQEMYWSKFMSQKYYWGTLTEELLLFSPCELWISSTCYTVYSHGFKYIYTREYNILTSHSVSEWTQTNIQIYSNTI